LETNITGLDHFQGLRRVARFWLKVEKMLWGWKLFIDCWAGFGGWADGCMGVKPGWRDCYAQSKTSGIIKAQLYLPWGKKRSGNIAICSSFSVLSFEFWLPLVPGRVELYLALLDLTDVCPLLTKQDIQVESQIQHWKMTILEKLRKAYFSWNFCDKKLNELKSNC
jgi:hypothetical protein